MVHIPQESTLPSAQTNRTSQLTGFPFSTSHSAQLMASTGVSSRDSNSGQPYSSTDNWATLNLKQFFTCLSPYSFLISFMSSVIIFTIMNHFLSFTLSHFLTYCALFHFNYFFKFKWSLPYPLPPFSGFRKKPCIRPKGLDLTFLKSIKICLRIFWKLVIVLEWGGGRGEGVRFLDF
jgi:hypothetical protein